LDDYVPFYFTSRSPMLLNIKTGKSVTAVPMEDIIIFVTSLRTLAQKDVGFVFTDRHAYLQAAHFSADLSELTTRIPWSILQSSDFKYDPQTMDKMERYQAEALVYKSLSFDHIAGVFAYSEEQATRIRSMIASAGYLTPVKVDRRFYF
jgi:hypothetical protein